MAKTVFPYQQLAIEPKFREAANGKVSDVKLRRLAEGLGYSFGATAIRKARIQATATVMGIPISVAAPADEWMLPTVTSSTRIAEVVETKRAPSQGGKWERFVVASDIHGDELDVDACNALFKFMDSWKPPIRICAGDVFDFRPLRKGAAGDEREQSMAADYAAGRGWMDRFYGGGQQNHMTYGNHDDRLFLLAEYGKGVERDFAVEKVNALNTFMGTHRVNCLPYDKRKGVLQLGHLKVLHGFHCGIYASRQTALIYGSALFGHTHGIDEHHIAGLERRAARNIGCLCSLNMGYASRMANTLKHAHGFAFGVLNRNNGNYQVWQAESVSGVWIVPSDVVEL